MDLWRSRLDQKGEILLDYHDEDIILRALSTEYDYVKNKSYNDRDVDLESVRKTVNNKYAENLSRSSRDGTKSVAGQGTTTQRWTVMSATTAEN